MKEHRGSRWQRRAEHRPREICAAALDVFAEKGFAAAKLDKIARRAGVSKGTLYLYFKDKDELFRAVVRDTIGPDIDGLRSLIVSSERPFAESARILLQHFAEMTLKVPVGPVAKMVIGESRNFPKLAKVWHDEVVSKAIGLLVTLIEKAQESAEVRTGDPRLQAFSLMGPMMIAVLWRETLQPAGGVPIDIEAMAKQHCETILNGLLK
jgi:AcrR family transcriptional regulator